MIQNLLKTNQASTNSPAKIVTAAVEAKLE